MGAKVGHLFDKVDALFNISIQCLDFNNHKDMTTRNFSEIS